MLLLPCVYSVFYTDIKIMGEGLKGRTSKRWEGREGKREGKER